jgi:Zn-finger nucleic acid-binding protein
MNFVICIQNRGFPEFNLGPVGSELSCYVPDGISWQQLNYGQREGQVEVDGCEWGFYLDRGELHVCLEVGEMPVAKAIQFVDAVAAKISRGRASYEIHFRASPLPT